MRDAMKSSIFHTLRKYFGEILWGVRSTCSSFTTAIPYLFSAGDLRKEVTEQYPDPISSKTADDLPSRSRGLLYNDIDRCTGCKDCEQVCPVDCIEVKTETGMDTGKVWVSKFDIDFAKCVSCGLCVDVCAPQSLKHTRNYERAVYELPDLIARFGRGEVSLEQKARWDNMRQVNELGGPPL